MGKTSRMNFMLCVWYPRERVRVLGRERELHFTMWKLFWSLTFDIFRKLVFIEAHPARCGHRNGIFYYLARVKACSGKCMGKSIGRDVCRNFFCSFARIFKSWLPWKKFFESRNILLRWAILGKIKSNRAELQFLFPNR